MSTFPEYVPEGVLAARAVRRFSRVDLGTGSSTSAGETDEATQVLPTQYAATVNMFALGLTGVSVARTTFGHLSPLADTPHWLSLGCVVRNSVIGASNPRGVVISSLDLDATPTIVRKIDTPTSGPTFGLIDRWSNRPHIKPGLLDPVVRRSLDSQRTFLLGLKKDWDGYGAEPLPEQRVDSFISELKSALVNYSGPLPEVVPGADGSLQAEWHRKYLKLLYCVDGDDMKHLFLKVADKVPITISGEAASSGFVKALRVHFPQGDTAVTNAATK